LASALGDPAGDKFAGDVDAFAMFKNAGRKPDATLGGAIMKWAFIYTLDDPSERMRTDVLGSMICVGVPNVDEGAKVAARLANEGVELIELCGGFGAAGTSSVIAAVEGRVPVGAVFYGVEASAGLQRLFGTHG
jgi:hypothetical protein